MPLIKSMGNTIIAMTANTDSYLYKQSTWTINTSIEKEACPNNLAPTTSTTAQLVTMLCYLLIRIVNLLMQILLVIIQEEY